MKRKIRLERDIIDHLVIQSKNIILEAQQDPFISRSEYQRRMSKKFRLKRPVADNVLKLLETDGFLKRHKKRGIRI